MAVYGCSNSVHLTPVMMFNWQITRREWVIITPVLLLAAWFRLGYVGVNSFAFDEAQLSLIALRMARAGEFASVGMTSSAGVPNMPAAAWLFALPYALSANPYLATGLVSLLSVLIVAGIWLLARQWSPLSGFCAALFLAANPYAILYGRSIWAQNLLIPLAVAWLWAVYAGKTRSRWWLALVVFLAGFAPQVHFAGAALVLTTAYAFLRYRWWKYPLPILVGGVVAAICALPFMLTPGALSSLLGATDGNAQIDASALRESLRLITGTQWEFLLQGEVELPLTRLTPTIAFAGLGSLLALLVGMMGLFGAAAVVGIDSQTANQSRSPEKITVTTPQPILFEMALVLLIAPLVLFTRHTTPVFIHYLLPTLPATALLAAWMASRSWLRYIISVIVLIMALGWTGQLIRAFPIARDQFTPNGMAEPLGVLHHAANALPAEKPILFFTHGDDTATQGEPAIFAALWWGRDARIIDGRTVFILPPYPATMIFTERPFQAWEEMRASELFVDLYEIPRRETVEPFQVTRYDGETIPAGFTLLDEPVSFAHGGKLHGWRTYTIGTRTRISTLWESSGSIGENVQQFHHLRTADTLDDAPLMVSDVSVRGHLWQPGDTVIVMADFVDLQPGVDYVVDVGHYTLPDVTRIAINGYNQDVMQLGKFSLE